MVSKFKHSNKTENSDINHTEQNMDLEQIVTPVKVNVLEKLPRQSNYDKEET